MNIGKKLLALLLAIMMVCSFTACLDGADPEDVRGDQSTNKSDDEKEFSMGETDGLTYENEFIGLGCTLDSEWTFYTDEQIREINNITADMLDEDVAEAIANATVVYDMYATHSNQLDSINVNLEKVNLITLTKLDVAENLETVFSILEEEYEKVGYTNIDHEIVTVEIDGKDYAALSITAEMQGITMYQMCISVKCSGYLASITVTTFGENLIDSILDNFYTVD